MFKHLRKPGECPAMAEKLAAAAAAGDDRSASSLGPPPGPLDGLSPSEKLLVQAVQGVLRERAEEGEGAGAVPLPWVVSPAKSRSIHHTPNTIHHAPYTMHRAPCTIHHTPCTIHLIHHTHHSPYTMHHTPYTIHCTTRGTYTRDWCRTREEQASSHFL